MSRDFFVVDFFALFFADDDFFLELETFLGNILIQPNEADEVRNDHQAIHGIREIPDHIQRRRSTDEGDEAENDAVADDDGPGLDEVFQGLFAVIFPAQDGREGEQGQGEDTMSLPYSPKTELKARMVSCAPVTSLPVDGSMVPSVPDDAMTRPVSIQMIIVSKKVPVILI